jgi:hypothetical protein
LLGSLAGGGGGQEGRLRNLNCEMTLRPSSV